MNSEKRLRALFQEASQSVPSVEVDPHVLAAVLRREFVRQTLALVAIVSMLVAAGSLSGLFVRDHIQEKSKPFAVSTDGSKESKLSIAPAEGGKTLLVGVLPDNPPFSVCYPYKSKCTGLDVDLATSFGKHLGYSRVEVIDIGKVPKTPTFGAYVLVVGAFDTGAMESLRKVGWNEVPFNPVLKSYGAEVPPRGFLVPPSLYSEPTITTTFDGLLSINPKEWKQYVKALELP
jgi:ABC-type amino acid transport substrate-binding protein